MRKYLAIVRLSIQNTLTYRGPIFVWLLSNIITLVTLVAVWQSASAGETIAGYTKSELISYYIIALFLQWLTGWMPFYWIKDDIKDGSIITGALIKPISFYWRAFAWEVGWHIVSTPIGLLASAAVIVFIPQYFVFNLSPNILLVALATLLSIFLMFSLSLCMGMLAFWFTHINAIDSLFWSAKMILGGQGIPVSFLPNSFFQVAYILPFRYLFSFPLEIYFRKISLSQIISGFGIQLGWILLFSIVYKLMWEKGRRVYTAFGH